jgi:hypothetical protein
LHLANLCREVVLDDLEGEIDRILLGGQKGRVLVNMKP